MAQGRVHQEVRSRWIISILLMALALRALVPVGFMPSAEHPFSVQICPDGFPAQLLDHGHGFHHEHAVAHEHGRHDFSGGRHQHDAARSEHCVFAAMAGIGPTSHATAAGPRLDDSTTVAASFLPAPFAQQRYYIPQPRGPPRLA